MLASFPPVLLVALGGGVGAVLRWLVGGAFGGMAWGTLVINVLGSFLLGWLVARLGGGGEPLRLLLGVGVLGGFTTFSTFSVEMMTMLERGEMGAAVVYAGGSVLGGLMAAALGLMLGRG
jgi:CrcB protein